MDKEALLKKRLPNQDIVMKVLGVLCGIGMMILSILCFINYKTSSPIDVVLPIYYL